MMVNNPILRGFNPDPSIIRVNEDYYIATSTFEWFPGIQIHHSKDLIHWKLIGRPLNRVSQLDMRGVGDDCGVRAPCLSYDAGIFYLGYSIVRNCDGLFIDSSYYIVTSHDIRGEWSDPIYLKSGIRDGSLFHDSDGRKYHLSTVIDHRRPKRLGSIMIQEYHPKVGKLIGSTHVIDKWNSGVQANRPRLYRRNEYYYLTLAQVDTVYDQTVSMARSKEVMGPYETRPDNCIITSYDNPEHRFQRNGYGELVETTEGRWYYVHTVERPLQSQHRSILGGETAVSEMQWDQDGWIYAKNQKKAPIEFDIEAEDLTVGDALSVREDFNTGQLNKHFQSLRIPITTEWANLDDRPGYLRMYGRDSLSSHFNQSLIARRLQHLSAEVSTQVEFDPKHYQEMAGLVCFYNSDLWHYIHISCDEAGQKVIQLLTCDHDMLTNYLDSGIILSEHQSIGLRVTIDNASLQFYYCIDQDEWIKVGSEIDMSILRDGSLKDRSSGYLTSLKGFFVGICCQDLTGSKRYADFDWFEYVELG